MTKAQVESSESVGNVEEIGVDMREIEWNRVVKSALGVLIIGVLFSPIVAISNYVGYLGLLILMFGVMAVGYNIMLGWPNLLVFSPAAFAVLGGITSALLAKSFGIPVVVSILIGGGIAAIAGTGVAASAILIGSAFEIVITTLAFEQIVYLLLTNWERVGPTGISQIPNLAIGPVEFTTQLGQYYFLLVILTLAVLATALFDRSLTGTLTIAVSENEDLLRSIGYSPARYKYISVIFGAFLLGIGGGLYAHVNGLITPASFTIGQTVFLLVIVIIGGLRTIYGPIVGAVIMVGAPEVVRTLGLGKSRPYIIGMVLILVILLMPRGVMGQFKDRFESKEGVNLWRFLK